MATETPDISLLEGVVAPRILEAMILASAQLRHAGVRHALVGGLAVGAYGYPRATRDVDFLVGDEAFEFWPSGIITMRPGVPISIGNVAVDSLSIAEGESYLNAAVDAPHMNRGIPVAPVEVLIYLKLKSPRQKDAADIVELLKAGVDEGVVNAYLLAYAPSLLGRFRRFVILAAGEED